MTKLKTTEEPAFAELSETYGGAVVYDRDMRCRRDSCESTMSIADEFSQVGVFPLPRNPERIAETEARLRDLIGESVSENTLKTYRGALRRLGAFMGIDAGECVNVDLNWMTGRSPATSQQ